MCNFLILGILLFLSASAFAQITPITDSEYWATFRAASDLSDKIPNRAITVEDYFKAGKKSGFERHLHEELPPNRSRYLYEAEFDGVPEKREIIKIDGVSYCREDKGKWKKENCDRFTGLSGLENIKIECSVQVIQRDNKSIRQLRRLMTYDAKDRNTIRQMYSESKFDLDESGKLLGEESSRGYLESSEWKSTSKTSYEYNPANLKIEAPIK